MALPCEDRKYMRVICDGMVVVCGDSEDEVDQNQQQAELTDDRCKNMRDEGGNYN